MNTRARAPSTITDPPKRRLGRSAVSVTPLGLGGAGIGNLFRKISDEHAQDVIRAALDADVELIDTAPYYGFGLSERRIGAALRAWPASRAIVSTKVGRVLEPLDGKPVEATRHGFVSSEPFEPRFDYSYDGVMRSFESSLQRLGVERVGVLLCHDLGRMTHGAEHDAQLHEFLQGGYRAMQRLRAQGAVGAIGLGVNECEICTTVLADCELDCILLAGRYTLLEQPALAELLPQCAARGVSIIVGGPFNSGILASLQDDSHYNYDRPPPAILERARRIAAICTRYATPLQAAALQFPLAHPQVAAVIPGCSSVEEVRRAREWMDFAIPTDLWPALREANLLHSQAPVPS